MKRKIATSAAGKKDQEDHMDSPLLHRPGDKFLSCSLKDKACRKRQNTNINYDNKSEIIFNIEASQKIQGK